MATATDDAAVRVASDLRAALEFANLPALLAVLVQLTGDERWLADPYRPVRAHGLDDNDSAGLAPEDQAEIRDAAFEAITRFNAGLLTPRVLETGDLTRMLGIALAEEIPDSYGPLLAEEFGLQSRDIAVPWGSIPQTLHVVVIGSGLSGICAAIKMQAAGIPFTIIEKNDSIGGTWYENTYPGCGVDTPSNLYSFSFAPNPKWSRYFARQAELSAYLEQLADDHDLRRNVLLNTEAISADFDESSGTWNVFVRDAVGGERLISGAVLISAVGQLNRPSIPTIPGLDSFQGPVVHTAQWDPELDIRGKRVAIVGTGASAMQLVPAIVDDAERVIVFQRSKQWAIPNPNYHREVSPPVQLLLANVPFYAAWLRLRAFWIFSDKLHAQLQVDPEWPDYERSINAANDGHRRFLTRYIESELGERTDLIDACVPEYPPYGKRPLIDNGWFRTICRDDVDLVTAGVEHVSENTITASSGEEFEVDAIVLATGFKALQFLWPIVIRGRSGVSLTDVWGEDDARAYLGMTVPGFPNFFILNGPNTSAGHGGSAIHTIEFEMRYVMQGLSYLINEGAKFVDVRPGIFEAYNNDLDDALSKTIWVHPGMTTYYRNASGRVVVSSPWTYLEFWQRTREFNPDDFIVDKSARPEG